MRIADESSPFLSSIAKATKKTEIWPGFWESEVDQDFSNKVFSALLLIGSHKFKFELWIRISIDPHHFGTW